MPERISEDVNLLQGEPTAHLAGEKKVFLRKEDTPTKVTQFAHGSFKPGEKCPMHSHPTMEEFFYFIEGEGVYKIGENSYSLKSGTFLRIPAGVSHELTNTGIRELKFVYFGVALD